MIEFQIEDRGTEKYLVKEIPQGVMCDTVGIGMLCNNLIPGLVPLTKETDHITEYLKYQISSYNPLSQSLIHPIDRKSFLQIISQILNTIMQLEDYMMEPGFLLLSPEYIYYDKDKNNVALIYDPMTINAQEFQITKFVKEMIMNMEFNTNEDNSYIAKIINILNSKSDISIGELLEAIEELNIPASDNKVAEPEVQAPTVPVADQSKAKEAYFEQAYQKPMFEANNTYQEPVFQMQQQYPYVEEEDSPTLVLNVKDEGSTQVLDRKGPVVQNVQMNMSARSNIKLPSMQPVTFDMGQLEEEAEVKEEPVRKKWSLFRKRGQREAKDTATDIPAIKTTPMSVPMQMTSSEDETMVLGMRMGVDSEETTQLSTELQQNSFKAFLIKKGTNEKIGISKDIYKIGKEQNRVDYCILHNTAVSRMHADIIYQQDQFYIVDNNSLNHTFVNGEQIPSNRPVRLSSNSTISFANEEFEFVIS